MLNYFKDRSFDKGNFKELVSIVSFALGFIAYIIIPVILIAVNLERLAAAILIGVPSGCVLLAFFEICFPKDPNKEFERMYGEKEKCLSGTQDK